ncbi:MAG: flavin reductase family protein [Candidatus Omnitrophica bacterium]|nr:flavin reductase family protein [Candidatus Omnitrophota bacterium]MDD5488046.1 flavin reductase family protein [Candidatus Omnitrophota bacterium]
MRMKEVPLPQATRLVNHGPVVLVSSVNDGHVGITPVAWHMPISKDPPMVALTVGEGHYIHKCILENGDFVINIPSPDMAGIVVECGSCSAKDTDKTKIAGVSLSEASKVTSPYVEGALGRLECSLVRDEHTRATYDIIIGKVLYAAACPDLFDGHWRFSGSAGSTLHHLGGRMFCVPREELMDLRKDK